VYKLTEGNEQFPDTLKRRTSNVYHASRWWTPYKYVVEISGVLTIFFFETKNHHSYTDLYRSYGQSLLLKDCNSTSETSVTIINISIHKFRCQKFYSNLRQGRNSKAYNAGYVSHNNNFSNGRGRELDKATIVKQALFLCVMEGQNVWVNVKS
jgi:hypothetical protein